MDAAASSAQSWSQGGPFGLVSDSQHADERRCCGRRSRVVLTPRRWRQVGGDFCEPDRARQNLNPQATVTTSRSPGRARRKPLKPLRAGMPGYSGATVVTTRVLSTFRTRGCGCIGHPAFPAPSAGREIHAQLGRMRRGIADARLRLVGCLKTASVPDPNGFHLSLCGRGIGRLRRPFFEKNAAKLRLCRIDGMRSG